MTVADDLIALGIDPARFDPYKPGFQRLSLIGKPGKRDGWAKVHRIEPLLVSIGNWKTGAQKTSSNGEPVTCRTSARKLSLRRDISRAAPPVSTTTSVFKSSARADISRLPATVSTTTLSPSSVAGDTKRGAALEIWDKAKPCEQHPYLTTKRVNSYGLREHNGDLLIPLQDEWGNLHSLQRIRPDGTKRFLKGGTVKGHFYVIGERSKRVVIAEGYATAATLFEALGWCTVVAFNAGNIEPVAYALRRIYRRETFVFAADNDRDTPGNPGRTKAIEAARQHDGIVVVPPFRSGDIGTDWNDFERIYGMDGVERIYAAL